MKRWITDAVHNMFIHPLMVLLPVNVGNRLHDWHARIAFGDDRLDEIGLEGRKKQEAGEQWVRCEDRLPTEDDAEDLKKVWICSPIGAVWLCEYSDVRHGIYPVLEGGWYWMPTGLTRPQPPKEQWE